jgi:sec-independent protein translocase protein TatC
MAEPEEPAATEASFLSHLLELRNRLVYALGALAVAAVPAFYFANDIYALIARPLMEQMPAGTHMIATEIASPFVAPLKLAIVVAFIAVVPFVLYQVWAFIAPGLYRHERRFVAPLLISSTLLFYAGMAFAYFAVFPTVFQFFIATAPPGVTVMTDIRAYLDFVFSMFLAFGIAFEIPVAVVLLARVGVVDPDALAKKRPYVFLGIFVVAAILTPPDVFSQLFLGLPMYVLFELGLLVARWVRPAVDAEAAAGQTPPEARG